MNDELLRNQEKKEKQSMAYLHAIRGMIPCE
ncbi:hypothetical protein A2U01_0093163, partial [Trifolium medium]|nr:hypothetical protein [Trifolium medium]